VHLALFVHFDRFIDDEDATNRMRESVRQQQVLLSVI
jgi:hypothetical protein